MKKYYIKRIKGEKMFSVSVIVPNYNNEKYLACCLNSIISQTYPIKEIVVYDDCSTDGSRKILAEYAAKDQRVKIIYGKENVGVSAARDSAIQSTTSDYVFMLDADDFFYTNEKIENEMKTVEQIYGETGEHVIAFSQTVDVDEAGTVIGAVSPVDLSGNERFKIVTRLYKNHMPRDYCFPKELYNQCGGYTKDLRLYEDWELNIKFLDYTRFVYSGGYGTAYRHKEGGLSSVNYTKQLKTKVQIIKRYKVSVKESVCFYAIAIAAFLKNCLKGRLL